MNSPLYPHLIMIDLSGIISFILAVYVFLMRKKFNGATFFIILSSCIAVYSVGHVFELLSNQMPEMLFWIKVQYAALPFIPPLILIQVIRHFGLFQSISRNSYQLLFVVPLLTTLACWTNNYHHLLHRTVAMDKTYILSLFLFTPGPWYAMHAAYSVTCMIVALCLLVWRGLTIRKTYRKQIFLFVIAIVLPMAVYTMYLTGQLRYPIEPIPITLGVSTLLVFWGMFSSRLFELVPLAKERVFQSMPDGVVVIDANNRIVDFNTSACDILTHLEEGAIGHDFRSYWCSYKLMDSEPVHQNFEWHEQIVSKYFQVLIVPLFQNKHYVGKTITMRDITTQKLMEEELKRLAYTDVLTNISNRAYLLKKSETQLNLIKENGGNFSCILFDIDHFKDINDTYGHEKGDEALIHIVETIRSELTPDMIFGRYGGEEFVVSLPGTDLEEASKYAELLRKAIESSPLEMDDLIIRLTASFGVAALDGQTSTMKELLRKADQALYAVKAGGRNAVFLAVDNTIWHYDPAEEMNKNIEKTPVPERF
ncbi:histidine kinase N-terminal 7TM domain-containing protein [Aciduricibacillus chroicocephali]|uniref:Histidine kinase N-terminal 7TM domain-containing protein n=1 Tax=Aciduricibacillus chroicocephali TaxID=3054939 RepID=A0ABY9KV61_9BACI|nr:histidine kinase N-terminal 7TM domain-containing protein [Bacillaceae bacterium 44XB]